MKRKRIIILLFSLGFPALLFAQDEAKHLFKIIPTAGISWRSTVMNFWNFYEVMRASPIPYHYEKNIVGFSFNPGVQFYIEPANVIIEYAPNLRYDHMQEVWSDSCHLMETDWTAVGRPICIFPLLEEISEFAIDHNVNLFLRINRKGKQVEGPKVGLGISVVNAGKDFVDPTYGKYYNSQFTTFNLLAVLPIKNTVFLESKAQYIHQGFPYNPYRNFMCYSLRVYYKFDFYK